jgi:rod shape-determining protein MreD
MEMRWLAFFILAYVMLGLQIGLSGFIEIHHAQPNFLLLVVVFIAINAPRDTALTACLLLGLFQDLLMPGMPLGLATASYGLVGIIVINLQEVVYGDHFLTHFSLTLLAGIVVAAIFYLHGLIYPLVHHSLTKWQRPALWPMIATAIYSAILAPAIIFILQRMGKAFGFRAKRGYIK